MVQNKLETLPFFFLTLWVFFSQLYNNIKAETESECHHTIGEDFFT